MNEEELKKFEEKEIDRITQKVILVLKGGKTLTEKQVNKIVNEELKDDPMYKEIEEYNVHYSKERIKEAVLGNKLLNQGKGNLSLSWFNFYVYFRLPAGIVVSFLFLFISGLTDFLSLIDIVIIGALFWGLKERKLWAYKMNFIVLIAETILRPIGRTNDVVGFVIFVIAAGLLWLLPNWIYFKKRKYLFLYSYGNKEKTKNNLKKWNVNSKEKFKRFYNFISKNKVAILIIIIIVALFYWYGYRPSKIRHDCSWVEKHSGAISAITQEQYDECVANSKDTGNMFSDSMWCDKPHSAQPAKDWWEKANKTQYDFCIHEKGL